MITRIAPLQRLLTFVIAVAILAGFSILASPDVSWAEDVDGIAGAPATDTGPDTTRSRLSYQLEPGQQIEDRYYVRNTGTTAQNVTVYATDAFTSADGSYSLLESGAAPSDVGGWVLFDGGVTQLTLTLQPGEIKIIPFTLSAPADASPGDHAGGIIVSAVTASGQVQLDRRVGTRLYARIKGDLQTALTISSITSSYSGELNPFTGTTTITYTVSNSGNVSLSANAVARVRGIFGIPLSADATSEIPEMLPGDTRTISAEVTGVGQWVYLNPSVDLAAKVDDDALNPGPLPTASRDTVLFVVPWVLLALLVLAALVWLFLRYRRRSNDRRARAWVEYTETEALRKMQEAQAAGNAQDALASSSVVDGAEKAGAR